MSETLQLIGSGLLGAATVLVPVAVAWIGWRRARDTAQSIRAERVEVAREAGAAAVVGPLLERVEALEGRLDRCEEERESISTTARAAEERCRRRTDALEARVEELRDELAQRDEDVTRRVRVAVEEAVRRTTPPGAWRPDPTEVAAKKGPE